MAASASARTDKGLASADKGQTTGQIEAVQSLGLLGGQSVATVVGAALVFCLVATAFALLWSGKFRHGPVEMLMRRIAG